MRSLKEAEPLIEATNAALFGIGYPSAGEAQAAGSRWRSILHVAFARLNMGVDFGDRSPAFEGGLSDFGIAMLSDQYGQQVMNDRPGVLVYGDPKPLFFSSSAIARVLPSRRRAEGTFLEAARLEGLDVTQAERLAFELYGASFFETQADARLLMVMMALETLMEPRPRAPETQALVRDLIRQVKGSDLPTSEVSSIVGSLKWLESESIGQAGRRLVSVLGGRRYMDMEPAKFFTKCYTLRSALVHGHLQRPSRMDVDIAASNLQMLTGELLGRRLLHVTEEWLVEQGMTEDLETRQDTVNDEAGRGRAGSIWRTVRRLAGLRRAR